MKQFNLNDFHVNQWFYYNYKYINKNEILSIEKQILVPSINDFHKNVIEPLINSEKINKDLRINIIVKINSDNKFYSLTNLLTLKIINLNDLYDIVQFYYNNKHSDDQYTGKDLEVIIFNFRVLSNDFIPNNKSSNYKEIESSKNIQLFSHKISNINFPLTMDLYQWGNVKFNENFNECYLEKDNINYHFTLKDNNYICNVMTKSDVNLITFEDTLLSNDLSHFKREIFYKGSVRKLFIYNNFNIIFKAYKHLTKFLSKVKKADHISKKFITIDIETKVYNNKMEAICISIFDGKNPKSFFINNFRDSKEMIEKSIKYLCKPKYDGYRVYAHNFSMFDSIFLLNSISNLADSLNIKNRDGTLIEISARFKNVNLKFRDSYLLLTSSLDKLGKSFLNEKKSYFPYDFINETSLSYEGIVPNIKYFNDIKLNEYEEYSKAFKGKKWNLENETIKYCESDVILLYKVIKKFNTKIYNLFHVDVLKYPTLPSLAFGIYRSNFLNEFWNIPILEGKVYEFISKSYRGGHVDVYHHFNKWYEKVYRYDVNSLYPYAMANFNMPVAFPIEFEGDILNNEIYEIVAETFNLKKRFGFFECDISTPQDLFIPVLLKKVKIPKEGYRTIAPVGEWNGVYFSEELENARKYGYKFKVYKGYLFNNENIFKDYVDELYKMKCNSISGDPEYMISKLLLNSLYGRFGMEPISSITKLVTEEGLNELLENNVEITNKIGLEKNFLVSYKEKNDKDNSPVSNSNVNISLASAITSYSRIVMSFYKHLPGYKVFYSDTDSIDLNKPLPVEYIGKDLGKMKLEHIWKNVVYLSSKCYIGIDKEQNVYRKLKGVKVNTSQFKENPIELEDLKKLLYKNNELKFYQERWYKSHQNTNIEIKEIPFTISSNNNKRISIMKNDIRTYTIPINLKL